MTVRHGDSLPWNKRDRERKRPGTVVPWEVGVAGPEANPAHSEAKCRAGYGALSRTYRLSSQLVAELSPRRPRLSPATTARRFHPPVPRGDRRHGRPQLSRDRDRWRSATPTAKRSCRSSTSGHSMTPSVASCMRRASPRWPPACSVSKSVRLYHDQALFKEAGGGITPWHQDQHYWPLDTDRTITSVDASRGHRRGHGHDAVCLRRSPARLHHQQGHFGRLRSLLRTLCRGPGV